MNFLNVSLEIKTLHFDDFLKLWIFSASSRNRIFCILTNFHDFFQGPEISWRQLMCKLLGLPSDTIFYDNLLEMISERIGCPSRTQALVQLGLLSEEKVERLGTPLDTVSNHLASILSYDSEERDMILMRHEVKGKNLGQFSGESPTFGQKLSFEKMIWRTFLESFIWN